MAGLYEAEIFSQANELAVPGYPGPPPEELPSYPPFLPATDPFTCPDSTHKARMRMGPTCVTVSATATHCLITFVSRAVWCHIPVGAARSVLFCQCWAFMVCG